jgi:hypothetical protein
MRLILKLLASGEVKLTAAVVLYLSQDAWLGFKQTVTMARIRIQRITQKRMYTSSVSPVIICGIDEMIPSMEATENQKVSCRMSRDGQQKKRFPA